MAALYLRLCNAGSILFRNWVATFHCEPRRKINAQINFGLSAQILLGKTTSLEGVTEQIYNICGFLSDCLGEWNDHVEIKRTEFPCLNHFTTEQLVMLRKELAVLFKADEQVNNSVYLLLHPIHQHCTLADLRPAFNQAFKERNNQGKHESASSDTDNESVSTEDPEDIVQGAREFIDNLTECGYSKQLTLQALKNFGLNRLQEGTCICYSSKVFMFKFIYF